ncbi:MAG: hypothetical protein NTW94_07560 [Legionellales bacterium]|nr:hypothetical protein [Legionellales bacterium]
MKIHPAKKWGHYLPIIALAVFACNQAKALPFTIIPDPSVPFPTVISEGTSMVLSEWCLVKYSFT